MDIFLEEFLAGWQEMPGWARIGMSFFVFTVVVTFVEPIVRRRRSKANLATLAEAARATVHREDAFTAWFTMTVDGRPFEVRREFRTRGRGSSYRGPTGHLLITSTPLAGTRWQMHQVDVIPFRLPRFLARLRSRTGDAAFDERFITRSDGLPVREGGSTLPPGPRSRRSSIRRWEMGGCGCASSVCSTSPTSPGVATTSRRSPRCCGGRRRWRQRLNERPVGAGRCPDAPSRRSSHSRIEPVPWEVQHRRDAEIVCTRRLHLHRFPVASARSSPHAPGRRPPRGTVEHLN